MVKTQDLLPELGERFHLEGSGLQRFLHIPDIHIGYKEWNPGSVLKTELEESLTFRINTALSESSVQFSRSAVSDSATPWTAACQASLFITIS